MTALIIFGIIIFVIFAITKKKQSSQLRITIGNSQELKEGLVQNSLKNRKITISSPNPKRSDDESIIDVTDQSYKIDSTNNLIKYISGVPYWTQHYVYSYSELNGTSVEQKKFYNIFKINFLNGKYFDIEGNTNYAFILLFDLLNEYDSHKGISKLESQLKSLGQCYPKTKSYGISLLIKKMELDGYSADITRLREENSYSNQNNNSNYDYNYWQLGSKYKTKLNLKDEDVFILNSLIDTNNKFNSIEFCEIQLIRMVLDCINFIKEYYVKNPVSYNDKVKILANIEKTRSFRFSDNSINRYDEQIINQCIFKTCENAFRDYFKVGRKTDLSWYLHSEQSINFFNENILSVIKDYINQKVLEIGEIDFKSEIEINNYNRSRYKHKLNSLSEKFEKEKILEYKQGIEELAKRNHGNPYIENIYYEASKFITKYDKVLALQFYIFYLHHDLQSTYFDNKPFNKTIQKSLFKTNEQLQDFEQIVAEFINDKNLEKALNAVSKIYEVKRKKIQLDRSTIKEVQQQHSGTVELLNEYLRDESEEGNSLFDSQEINSEEINLKIVQQNDKPRQSAFLSELSLHPNQISILEIFSKHNFSVPQIEIEEFVKSKGLFKNQIIESINEACYEVLDDVLIEDEEDYYTIIPESFQKIITI